MIELRNKQGQLIRISGSETIVSVDGEEMSLQEAIDNGKIGQTLTVVQVLSDSTEDVPSAAAVKGAVNAVAASVASLAENTAKLATEVDGLGKEVQEVSDTVDSLSEEVANKQNKLKAGDNITIDPDGTISATGGGGGGSVTIDKTMPATPSDSHVPSTKLLNTELEKKQIKLKAGDNITINPDGIISASLAGGTTQVASEVSYTNADGSKTNVQAKLTELGVWKWETLDESQLVSGTWTTSQLASKIKTHTVTLQSCNSFAWHWKKLYAEEDNSKGIFPKTFPVVGEKMSYVNHSTATTGGGRGLADVCKKGDMYYIQSSKPANARPLVWAINNNGIYTIAINTANDTAISDRGVFVTAPEDGYIFFNAANDTFLVKKRMLMPTEIIAEEEVKGKDEGVYAQIPSQIAFGDIPTMWYRNQLGSDNSSYQDLCVPGQTDKLHIDNMLEAFNSLPSNPHNHGHLTVETIKDENGADMLDCTSQYPIIRAHWKPLLYGGEYGCKPIKIIITAVNQGQEHCSGCGLYYLLKDMLENCEKHPVLDYLATHVEMVLYPIVTPNACNPTPSYYNKNGVNINRNFPTKSWDEDHAKLVAYLEELAIKQQDPSYNPSADEAAMNKKVQDAYNHCGQYGGDQAETKAVVYDILKNHKDALLYIDFHTCGNVQAVDWASTNWWIVPHGNNIMTDAIRDAAKEYFPALNHYTRRDYPMSQGLATDVHLGKTSESDIDFSHLGGAGQWGREQGFISFTIEGHNGFYQDESYNVGNRGQKHCSEIITNVLMYLFRNLKKYSI